MLSLFMNRRLKELLSRKPLKITIILIYALALVWVFIPHIIHQAQTGPVPKGTIVNCPRTGQTIMVNIDDQKFNPQNSNVKVCDKIVFKNKGSKYYEPAFGEHPKHLIYPGYAEKPIKPGTTNSLVMKAFGNFEFHEHIYNKIEGRIIVEKN